MKTVFITGATSGIGKATVKAFAVSPGFRFVLCGRRKEKLIQVCDEIWNGIQTDVQLLSFDIRSYTECQTAIESLEAEFRNVDILINNAGLAKGLDYIYEGKLDHWETMIDTNIKGLLYISRILSPGMVERKSGHIINVCSTAGKEVYPKGNVYCATKFAVDALTKAMRQDFYMHNIRVSQVAPGHVEETDFALNRFDGDTEKSKIYNDFNPLKACDVAETIYFIATRPPHVNIQDVLMMGTQQASSTMIDRSGRKFD